MYKLEIWQKYKYVVLYYTESQIDNMSLHNRVIVCVVCLLYVSVGCMLCNDVITNKAWTVEFSSSCCDYLSFEIWFFIYTEVEQKTNYFSWRIQNHVRQTNIREDDISFGSICIIVQHKLLFYIINATRYPQSSFQSRQSSLHHSVTSVPPPVSPKSGNQYHGELLRRKWKKISGQLWSRFYIINLCWIPKLFGLFVFFWLFQSPKQDRAQGISG